MTPAITIPAEPKKPFDEKELQEKVERAIQEAKSYLISRTVPLAVLIIRAKHRATTEHKFAETDGTEIQYGRRFLEDANDEERRFIIIHEILHIALGHCQRDAAIRRRTRPYSHQILNSVQDAYINECIMSWKPVQVKMPKVAQNKDTLMQTVWQLTGDQLEKARVQGLKLKNGDFIPMRFFHGEIWDFETTQVHDWLLQLATETKARMPKNNSENPSQGRGTGEKKPADEPPPEQQQREQEQNGSPDPEIRELEAMLAETPLGQADPMTSQDVRPAPAKPHESATQAQQRMEKEAKQWRKQLIQAAKQPGSQPGTGLLQILAKAPGPPPWHALVRALLEKHLTPGWQENPTVPSSETIALEAAGLPCAFYPDTTLMKQGGALALCIDTSASISDQTLQTLGEQAIATAHSLSSPVHIIPCDTQVHGVVEDAHEIPGGLQNLALHGRGGTAFGPAFEKAKEYQPRALVYLTDGYAEFPEKPVFPVIWVITACGRPEEEFPDYGYKVRIDPHQ